MKKITSLIFMMPLLLSCANQSAMIFDAKIAGENEVPPVETLAGGALYAVVGIGKDEMTVRVSVNCIEQVTAAHFHHALVGQNGGIIVTLFSGGPVDDPQNKFMID